MKPAMNRPDLELPAGVQSAVHTSAARAPALLPDLAGVRTRAHTIRRRRTALTAAAAAAAVLALGAAVPPLRSVMSQGDTIVGDPSGGYPIALRLDRDQPTMTETVPPVRSFLGHFTTVAAQLRTVNGKPTITPVGRQPGLGGPGTYAGPAALPAGWLATIGRPPAGQTTGIRVVVADAEGRAVASRPLPPTGTLGFRPMPMTGSGTTLYWWRFDEADGMTRPVLFAYDIAAGTLRELAPGSGLTGQDLPSLGMQATAERIVQWPADAGRTCSAEVLDARTGERVAVLRPAIAGCTDAYFALSPDNKRVAVLVTTRDAGSWSQRVIVIDARNGEIEEEFPTPPRATGTDRSRLVSGIDWAGRKTIRYARGLLPEAGRTGPDPIVLTFKLP